jgi:sterol 24-C-methyltransferase
MTPSRTGTAPWEGEPPAQIANRYYDATTWIYRRAWGSSFHFAPLRRGEGRSAAIRRYEHELAALLDVRPSCRVVDLGCGIGGPASSIAAATRARIVALNANVGQLGVMQRAARRRPDADVRAVCGDYARLPFGADAFDVAYAFEALCHAVDLDAVFRDVHRVLRPGGMLGFSEWCLTDAFDAQDPSHGALRMQIERSYGVFRLRSWSEWHGSLTRAGFRLVKSIDRAATAAVGEAPEPWYRALLPRDPTLDSVGRRPVVRALEEAALSLAERVRLAPRGTAETVRSLRTGTGALIDAGRRGIFTPMRLVIAAKDRDV